jgi:Helix-turn-helix domain
MKTAQEWQDTLGLDWLPDEQETLDLNRAEDQETSSGRRSLTDYTVTTMQEFQAAVTLDSVGALFRRLREDTGLSLRAATEVTGMSRTRTSQIEQPNANLTLRTVSDMADRLGYDATLVLRPRGDKTVTFEAPLEHDRKEG